MSKRKRKSLVIGRDTFAVRYLTKKQIDPEGRGVVGHSDRVLQHIDLLKGTKHRWNNQTMWHEALHVIADRGNVKLKETEIDALVYGVTELLEANGLSADLT